MRPATPPPTTAVGRAAPPVEEEDEAAALEAAAEDSLELVTVRVGLAMVVPLVVAAMPELAPVPAAPVPVAAALDAPCWP